jgi:hypothetical protein
MGKIGHRDNNILKLGTHALAVVHDEPDGNGGVSRLEYREFLRLSVLKNLKVFLLKPGNKRTPHVTYYRK